MEHVLLQENKNENNFCILNMQIRIMSRELNLRKKKTCNRSKENPVSKHNSQLNNIIYIERIKHPLFFQYTCILMYAYYDININMNALSRCISAFCCTWITSGLVLRTFSK